MSPPLFSPAKARTKRLGRAAETHSPRQDGPPFPFRTGTGRSSQCKPDSSPSLMTRDIASVHCGGTTLFRTASLGPNTLQPIPRESQLGFPTHQARRTGQLMDAYGQVQVLWLCRTVKQVKSGKICKSSDWRERHWRRRGARVGDIGTSHPLSEFSLAAARLDAFSRHPQSSQPGAMVLLGLFSADLNPRHP